MVDVVQVKNLTKRYRDLIAINIDNLNIKGPGIYGLLGRNGAGKTTLLQLLAGHEIPNTGQVLINGENPLENSAILPNIAVIKESQKYPENFNLHYVLKFASQAFEKWDDLLASELVNTFKLPLKKHVRKLSRGQLSAVGIIVGLASRAPITIYDEPYLGMDAVARKQFYDILLADYARHPRTIILSTHLIDEVADLLDHVFVIDGGKLILDNSVDELQGSVHILEGSVDQLNQLSEEYRVLESEELGNQRRLVVSGIHKDQVSNIISQGIRVQPASLQRQIIARTSETTATMKDAKL